MPITDTQLKLITEEAERAYPGEAPIPFLERGAYIKSATLYQERINVLMEAIDVVKKWLPDGPSNELKKYLDTYNKTINNG